MRVDQKMERQKRRSSTNKTRPNPEKSIEKIDSTNSISLNNSFSSKKSADTIKVVVENAYEPIDNIQAKIALKHIRVSTINDGGDDSSDESDLWTRCIDRSRTQHC